jgi:hypothetical protein
MALAEDVRRSLGIRRPVRLLQNRSVPYLGTWGIVAPRVLLPADAESWPDDRVRMVLGHELAHIKRHDWMVQVLADAARAIYWFNPIFWLASNRLRRESEHACDDAVVRMGIANTEYAEELLKMTRALRSEGRNPSPILSMAQPSQLEQRLVALLNPSLNRLAATPWAVIVVSAAAIALTAPLASVRSHETYEAKPELKEAAAPAPSIVAETPSIDQLQTVPAVDDVSTRRVSHKEPAPLAKVESPISPEHDAPEPAALTPRVEPVSPTPVVETATPTPFECHVTSSVRATRPTQMKQPLGDGPWLINEDKTIWAADQPYVAGREVNTVWMKPPNTDLVITARRLDGDAPPLQTKSGVTYNAPYLAIGMTFPQPGCWEITASAGGSQLTFVTTVQE